jgi:hypothetical protein
MTDHANADLERLIVEPEGERRAFDELVFATAPLRDLGSGVRRAVEQVETHRVAKGPVVEILGPAIRLRRRDPPGIAGERSQHTRLVHVGFPERCGKFLVVPKLLAERLNVSHRYAECVVRGDGIARHAVVIFYPAARTHITRYQRRDCVHPEPLSQARSGGCRRRWRWLPRDTVCHPR